MKLLSMASTQLVYAVLVAVVLLVVVANSKNIIEDDYSKYCTACNEAFINRRGFPDGFVFGSASGHYQIEGAYNESGKGPSMWDQFTHTYPEKIKDHTNGDIAIDSYHLYKEDVRILKDIGVDAYKFSISWARILPGGSINKGVNQEGIDYYNNLINELIANDIEPWVTMIHLDTSQALEDEYGGFLSSQIVADFRDFAEVLFREFGDRVKYWITINEPWGLSYLGYTRGIFAPGRCSPWIGNNCSAGDSATEPYKVTHNQLLAHAAAVKLYTTKYQEVQKGKIGLTVNSFWFVPYDERKENVEATYRALDFMLGWVLDPITFGKYPESMRSRVGGGRLPEFTNEEAEMVKGSFDFIGVNYYSANYAQHIDNSSNESYLTDSGALFFGEKDGIPIGEQGSSKSWYYMYPSGLRKLLQYIKEKYNDPLMYITENGLDEDRDDSIPMAKAINDYKRKDNFLNHLCCLREAIQLDGVNVKGFFAWSLTDNFEWISGYLVRFGLNYVDFNDKSFKRYPKLSAKWFKSILADRRVTGKTESRRISDQ